MVFPWSVSDVGEHRAGHYGDGDCPGEVVVLAIAFVPQVERLLEIALLGWQRHLTHEGIHQHVVVVDLNADWLVGFLPVEEPLGVEDGAASVFMDWRTNFVSFATNYHVGVRHSVRVLSCESISLQDVDLSDQRGITTQPGPAGLWRLMESQLLAVRRHVGEDAEQEVSLQARVKGRGYDDVAPLCQVDAKEHRPRVDVDAPADLLLGDVHTVSPV